jgi:hypothetical protein
MFILTLLLSEGQAVDDREPSKQSGFLSAVGKHKKNSLYELHVHDIRVHVTLIASRVLVVGTGIKPVTSGNRSASTLRNSYNDPQSEQLIPLLGASRTPGGHR